ncbi:MAG: hypothetical protein K9M98_00800 [Cephaloticoccus sp.]|nr:hypothetical protein [Cephaloticoccus sp.]MCF7759016.1 hypothetical protein [Cephaloticoccus sp.]
MKRPNQRILALQFGNVYQRRQRGYILLSRLYTHPAYGWLGPVNEGAGRNIREARLEGYVHSTSAATLALGLPDGDYKVVLTCFTKEPGHGPFRVNATGVTDALHVRITPRKISRHRLVAQARNNRLDLKFTPAAGHDFLINTIEVFAPASVDLQPLFRQAPPAAPPSRVALAHYKTPDPTDILRQLCDWLLRHREPDGFLGDTHGPGQSFWYTASMPLRTLLAGHRLLRRPRYLDAATKLLDLFVGEQLPNGAWEAGRRGQPTKRLATKEVERILREERLPMSDIGSMVTALAVAMAQVSGARQRRYLNALRLFCDEWAPRFQRSNGAFDDGVWPQPTAIYSCSTAIQASTYALVAKVTGDLRYLKVANRAMRFLLKDWRTDGRMLGRAPHWVVHNGKPFVLDRLHFGDQWYYDEGFITTWHHTTDASLRHALQRALHHRVHGRAGLLAAQGNATWWPFQDIWNNAKSVGMVQTLLFVQRHGKSTPRLEQAITEARHLLSVPALRRSLGVMTPDRGRPITRHAIRSWAGLRMEATGFAGMTLAEMIQPGALYLSTITRLTAPVAVRSARGLHAR